MVVVLSDCELCVLANFLAHLYHIGVFVPSLFSDFDYLVIRVQLFVFWECEIENSVRDCCVFFHTYVCTANLTRLVEVCAYVCSSGLYGVLPGGREHLPKIFQKTVVLLSIHPDCRAIAREFRDVCSCDVLAELLEVHNVIMQGHCGELWRLDIFVVRVPTNSAHDIRFGAEELGSLHCGLQIDISLAKEQS